MAKVSDLTSDATSRELISRAVRIAALFLSPFVIVVVVLDLTIAEHHLAVTLGSLTAAIFVNLALLLEGVLKRVARRPALFAYAYEAFHAVVFCVLMFSFSVEATMAVFGMAAILLVVHSRMISPRTNLIVTVLAVFGIYSSSVVLNSFGILSDNDVLDLHRTEDLVVVAFLTVSVASITVYYFLLADLARSRADEVARVATNELHVVARDRERIAALHKEARALAVRLERREQDLKDFVQITTHDLTNVALGTRLVAEKLIGEMGDDFSETGRDMLDAIAEDTKQFTEMLNALQALFLKSEEEEERQRVDCRALVGRILDSLGSQISEKGIALDIGNLPQIDIEERKLFHVLSNLIGNAVKYVGDKPHPWIRITAIEGEDSIRVNISDNGIGIGEREQRMILKPFKRGFRQTVGDRQIGGAGIGLALVKRIVERWGGSLAVESEAGKGSTFSVEIPKKGSVPPA